MKTNQAPDKNTGGKPRYTGVLRKRELAAYYILCGEGDTVWNIGDALGEIKSRLNTNRKIAHSIIRRFTRIGLLIRVDKVTLKCLPFEEYVRGVVESYLERRSKRGRG